MEKLEIKETIKSLLCTFDMEHIKNSIWEMHESLMMSEREISIEERQRFTFACRQMADILSDLDSIREEVQQGA